MQLELRFNMSRCGQNTIPTEFDTILTHSRPNKTHLEEHQATQKEVILSLLLQKITITNQDLVDIGIQYVGRNRISELRAKGYVIAQKGAGTGHDWLQNAYMLVRRPGEMEDVGADADLRRQGWKVHPNEKLVLV